MTKKVDLIGIDTQYGCDVGGVFRQHTQDITDDFLTGLKEQRNTSKDQREGEFMRVASIPSWWSKMDARRLRHHDGKHTAAEIVKRLKQENLDASSQRKRASDGHTENTEDGHEPENREEEDRQYGAKGYKIGL